MSKDRVEMKDGVVKANGMVLDPGSVVMDYGLLIWMGYAIGPWEVALLIFLLGCLANISLKMFFSWVKRQETLRAYGKGN